ncbi:hypothetical protein HID58_005178, partial [Brassica napus]
MVSSFHVSILHFGHVTPYSNQQVSRGRSQDNFLVPQESKWQQHQYYPWLIRRRINIKNSAKEWSIQIYHLFIVNPPRESTIQEALPQGFREPADVGSRVLLGDVSVESEKIRTRERFFKRKLEDCDRVI